MTDENNCPVIEAVQKAATGEDGKKWLTCAQAFQIASECGVKPVEVGRACDSQGIRVHNCQLGLF